MSRCRMCNRRYLLTWMPLVSLHFCSWKCARASVSNPKVSDA